MKLSLRFYVVCLFLAKRCDYDRVVASNGGLTPSSSLEMPSVYGKQLRQQCADARIHTRGDGPMAAGKEGCRMKFREDGTFHILQFADIQEIPDVSEDTLRLNERGAGAGEGPIWWCCPGIS